MSNEWLTKLHGEIISHFSVVKYLSLGVQRVIIHLCSGVDVSLAAREVKLGADETYTIEAERSVNQEGTQRIDAGWRIGEVRTIERQDWLELGSNEQELVGNNPRTLTWGIVGSAPETAVYTEVVDFGVAISSEDGLHQAMIYLADYPGLVCFTRNAQEIRALCDAYMTATEASSSGISLDH
jgi:hypothetical protein